MPLNTADERVQARRTIRVLLDNSSDDQLFTVTFQATKAEVLEALQLETVTKIRVTANTHKD